jgi:hypothetical protein
VACIDPGPLFPTDEVSVDAGVRPAPALGQAGSPGSSGAAGAPPVSPALPSKGEGPPLDAGLIPSDGPPLPTGPIDVPPGCDAGSAAGCADEPDEPPPEDECNDCLAYVCPADIERCDETYGCAAIVACARSSGCELDACYCGTFNQLLCSTGQANGPCRDVMLAAPGSHPPSIADPNAGPASVAARSVGACRLASEECREVCGG